ncbi:ATP synthase F1 subunit delta [Mucilaginibacter sp.]|uniref:ATP synthase F1 subunit delta n=1 Tax=Mucilaginibacter sp. TaxID=1882438 RepID=UPI003B00A8E1
MSEYKVATRYAKSLIDLATEQNQLEAVKTDMVLFVETVRLSGTLNAVLRNPIVSPSKKASILTALFGDKVQPATLGFFKIMIAKMRSEILFDTAKEFIEQYNLKQHIVKASVVSAVPLSESNRAEVVAIIKKATDGNAILEEKIDPKLIGGFILTVGDRQFDTSIANTLNKLKKDFGQKTAAELV